eukprot:CAMPEP_0170648302 /NCGR_PEP_ID=MMETSP0224-20130122/44668_1 /TAXON_ID=285029 /ORGANISM="Togula jolla, Strain CCCM 725" /LENGTH=94 /DNA_ID=CAMNT_0010979831 /DNA_START=149 /DNA_END=433 /DNA_ORIENTATION=-
MVVLAIWEAGLHSSHSKQRAHVHLVVQFELVVVAQERRQNGALVDVLVVVAVVVVVVAGGVDDVSGNNVVVTGTAVEAVRSAINCRSCRSKRRA